MNDLEATQLTPLAVVETSSSVLAAQAKALVEARYTVAFARPRDIDKVRERLVKEAKRPGFALAAIYHKPIGNGIEGPSIRFAEAAILALGNITTETATIFDDPERRIVRVTVTDLESNVPYSQDVTISKTVERRTLPKGETAISTRTGAGGQLLYILAATDDDILNKANALVSKAIRTLGLRLLPGDIQDEVLDICKKTRRDRDAQDPEGAKKQIFDAFGKQGVSVEQLKVYLGHDAKLLTTKEQETLRGLFNALRDGETTWREIMDKQGKDADGNKPEALKTETQKKAEDLAANRTKVAPVAGLDGMAVRG
jgi:hypothetical protein